MQKAASAEQKLANIANRLGVTQSGLFWMDHALDPFKDLVKPHPGYPDKNMDPSIVEVVKTTAIVTAPGAVPWDCSIFLDQVLNNINLRTTTAASQSIFFAGGQGATDYPRGGCVIRTATSGTPLDITTTRSNLAVDPNLYTSESCRIVAIGLEVHDTTAELDKQGSVIVWRLDKPTEKEYDSTVVQDNGVTACVGTTVKTIRLENPPNTGAEALDLLGSQQWEAKEGCYLVPIQVEDINPALPLRPSAVYVNDGVIYYPTIGSTGVAKLLTVSSATNPSPWSMTGAMFLGLKSTASLTLNLNYLVERFPNKASAIKRLCYPSPPFDNKALLLYSDIARALPVGVPVSENAAGDWIKGVANIAGTIVKMFPHPYAQMAGKGLDLVEDTIQMFEKIPKKQNVLALMPKTESTVTKKLPDGRIVTTHTTSKISNSGVVISSGGNYRSNKQPLKRPNRLKKTIKKSGVIVADNPWPKGNQKKH